MRRALVLGTLVLTGTLSVAVRAQLPPTPPVPTQNSVRVASIELADVLR